MGNSQSRLAKEDARRSNRLSKPLTRRFSAPPSQLELDHSDFNSGLIGWQNPWVGHTISTSVENVDEKRVEKRGSYHKKAEIPPTLFETESPEESPTGERAFDYDPAEKRHSARLSLVTAGSRRTSYQSELCFQPSPVSEHLPSRASSTRTALQRHNSAVYENKATSSNTHFLVGNQRFSLTRRRSLLTRPGVATRRTTDAIRRVPSPIGEPEYQIEDPTEPTTLQWPLPLTRRPPSPVRPNSPTDARYTQLGALKLGSLRVVNGSASPCPSERVPLSECGPVPGIGLENMQVARPSRGSALDIPSLADPKKADDVPGSPFSFEKSPTITVVPRAKSLFPIEPEDEAIVLFDDTRTQLEKNALGVALTRSTSRSLNKSDSGYSSATSMHSIQRSRTQSSSDSQSSDSCGADSGKNVWIANGTVSGRKDSTVQRHLNLQSTPENYSRLHLAATRWYDSSDPGPLAPSRSRRSTLCAPRYTEYSPREFAVPVKFSMEAAHPSQLPQSQQGLTRGPLYGDRFSVNSFDVVSFAGSSATWDPQTSQQTMSDSKTRLRRSASEHHLSEGYIVPSSRSKSRVGRIWTKTPGVEAPPLPTILSPGYLQDDLDHELNLEHVHSEPMRGRPRSRSHDYRRRRLTKSRPQADLCT